MINKANIGIKMTTRVLDLWCEIYRELGGASGFCLSVIPLQRHAWKKTGNFLTRLVNPRGYRKSRERTLNMAIKLERSIAH